MASLNELEKEYKEGILTKKGYRLKRMRMELDELETDLKDGDLTPQGFAKKKNKICEEYQSSSAVSAVEIASKVSSSKNVHSTLSKLFGTQSKGYQTKRALRNLKPITVILLAHGTKTLPRGKKKDSLRDSGNIASCVIGPNDNEETVNEKIITLFPSLRVAGFKMMTATKSGDVFEAEKLPNFDGETILEFIGNGPLLIQSRAAIVAPIVAPISLKQNFDDFQELDELFLHIVENESLYHTPERNNNPYECLSEGDKLQADETFMDITLDVYHWYLRRKESGHELPRQVDHFFIMNEDEMTSFFKFRDNKDYSTSCGDDILFPEKKLLKLFCQENKMSYKSATRYGAVFTLIPIGEIDYLCDWIRDKKEQLYP